MFWGLSVQSLSFTDFEYFLHLFRLMFRVVRFIDRLRIIFFLHMGHWWAAFIRWYLKISLSREVIVPVICQVDLSISSSPLSILRVFYYSVEIFLYLFVIYCFLFNQTSLGTDNNAFDKECEALDISLFNIFNKPMRINFHVF